MTPFEEELKKALVRSEPSEHFTRNVLARSIERRAEERGGGKKAGFQEWLSGLGGSYWRWASVAALIVMLASGMAYQQHRKTVKGEAAKNQLLAAMHIAGTQLHQAQLRVKRIQFPEVVMQ